MDQVTLSEISKFLDENPGASISMRRQRTAFSVRVTPAYHVGAMTVATSDDLEDATLKAIDAFGRRGQ